MRFRVFIISTVVAATLAGCTQFPELDAVQTPGVETAPYPKLVPLESLLTGAEPRATLEVLGAVEGRVAGLQARANKLRAMRGAPRNVSARLARLRQKAAALRAEQ